MYICYNKFFFFWYCLVVGLLEVKNDVNVNGKNGIFCYGFGDILFES